MKQTDIDDLRQEIFRHKSNRYYTKKGYTPLFEASPDSRIVIIGQAPGIKAQISGIPWDDNSGIRLKQWLGVSDKQFRDPAVFALMPMDFYYPGKGKSGDLAPRKDFAPLWHTKLMEQMPNIELIVLVGQYAQKYYLSNPHSTLTETVRNFKSYLPKYFPIVHPSPLNFRWQAKNSWFESEVIPELQKLVARIIS